MDSKSFHILVVLAAGPLHGYAIRQQVEERTAGEVRLWPATLYGLLRDLGERGWIEPNARPSAAAEDPRRRSYALTEEGRRALAEEATRLAELARLARSRLSLGGAS